MRFRNTAWMNKLTVVLFFALPVVAYLEQRELADWGSVEADVLRCWEQPDRERDRSDFFCEVRFPDGHPVSEATVNPFNAGFLPFFESYKAGDRMPVLYEKRNPKNLDVDSFGTRYPFSTVVCVILAGGVLGYVIRR